MIMKCNLNISFDKFIASSMQELVYNAVKKLGMNAILFLFIIFIFI